MISNYRIYFFCILFVCLMTSCTSHKKIPYFQSSELEGEKETNLITLYKENIIRFQPEDILSITINVPGEQSIASDFNLPVQPAATTNNSAEGEMSAGYGRQTYQINKNGEIDFPFLGAIKIGGYTKDELEDYLKKSLKQFMKVDPIVTVYLTNFRISVLGEVSRPGQYTISREHVNLLEAIALAGDLTIYGKRDNVRIMRKMPDGEVKIVQMDISAANIVTSPYFYLNQNDLIYVEPNKVRAKSADIGTSTNIIFTITSTLISLASFIIILARN